MINILGYAASGAVLATFMMRTMLSLRLVALASNFLFILYGHFAHIMPVLLLHIVLLPVNVYRLFSLYWVDRPGTLSSCVASMFRGEFRAGFVAASSDRDARDLINRSPPTNEST